MGGASYSGEGAGALHVPASEGRLTEAFLSAASLPALRSLDHTDSEVRGTASCPIVSYFTIQTSFENPLSLLSFARASLSEGNFTRTRKAVPFSVTVRST